MKTNTRTELKAKGFTITGTTTDQTMLGEIERDYNGFGYEVRWEKRGNKFHYWTKPLIGGAL